MARLLLPVSFTSAVSIFNALPRWNKPQAQRVELVAPPASPATEVFDSVPAATASPRAIQPSQQETFTAIAAPLTQPPQVREQSIQPTSSTSTMPEQPRSRRITWDLILFSIWGAGVVALLLHLSIGTVRLKRELAGMAPVTDVALVSLLEECRNALGVRTKLHLAASARLSTPALYGIFRPCLILPKGLVSTFSQRELRFVFLHELAHVKRMDLAANWVIALLQVVHWFNPLVWIAFARWRADREPACDAMALEVIGAEQNREYGQTILRLLETFTHRAAAPGMVGILEAKDQLAQRIKLIAAHRSGRRVSIAVALALAGLGVVFLTDARDRSAAAPATNSTNTTAASDPEGQFGKKPRPVVTDGKEMTITVIDSETGQPIQGANVLALCQSAFFGGAENSPRWTTDDKGVAKIRLGRPPTDTNSFSTYFNLSVRRAGFAPRGVTWHSENIDARVTGPDQLTIRLHKGISIGGMVRDEAGAPVAKVRVRAFGSGYRYSSGERPLEYSEFWTESEDLPQTFTDSTGRWELTDFPADLENMGIEFIRADGSSRKFKYLVETRGRFQSGPLSDYNGAQISLADLRATNAVAVLTEGVTVSGRVTDPSGQPLPNALVKEGYGWTTSKCAYQFRTDGNGRFVLPHRERRQMILTVCPERFAITSIIVDVGKEPDPVQITVSPLNPLQIRAVDAQGHPVPSVKVEPDMVEGQVLDFEGVTSAEGLLVWSNAPASDFKLAATRPGRSADGPDQVIRVRADQPEATFKFRDGTNQTIAIRAKARDAKTGAPVIVNSADIELRELEGFAPLKQVNSSEFNLEVLRSLLTREYARDFVLRLNASGYETLVTAKRSCDEGDWDAEFVFEPGGKPGGTVVLADGTPVANAEVVIAMRGRPIYFYLPNMSTAEGVHVVYTDRDGHFEFEYPGGDWTVGIRHEKGFLATTADKLKKQPRLVLPPWGRVEGTYMVGTNQASGIELNMWCINQGMSGWSFNLNTQTDDQGRFVFNQVPPGEHIIQRRVTARDEHAGVSVNQLPVLVKPGETSVVRCGGTGRRIIGRVIGDADLGNDVHTLALKVPPVMLHPPIEDYATSAAFVKARDQFDEFVRPKLEHTARSYPLRFESDNSFHIDDVPAGTYELRIRVSGPFNKASRAAQIAMFDGIPVNEVASLIREVIVPEMPGGRSDVPLDLGVLKLDVKQPQPARASTQTPIQLLAQTIEGEPFDLAAYRGTNVLLVFWAGFSERSLQTLVHLKELQAESGPRLQIVTVNLLDEPDAVRQLTAVKNCPCTHVTLSQSERARVAEILKIDTVPTTLLVNSAGNLVGRDLEGDALKSALQRSIAQSSNTKETQ